MNIVKLQSELKGVPDQTLVGYVQNPNGQVPTFLALSELQRRKEMRNKYQQQKPEKSVAESLVEESIPQPPMQSGIASAAPQQPAPQPEAPAPQLEVPQGMAEGGLASLPVDHMYKDESFATGGIVAFADGGEVKHYDGTDGSYVNPGLIGGPVQEGEPWYSDLDKWAQRNFDWSATNKAAREKGIGNEVTNPFLSGMPRTDIMDEYLGIKQKVDAGKGSYADIQRMKAIEGEGVPPITEPSGGGATPESIAAMKQQETADAQTKALQDKQKDLQNMLKQSTTGAKATSTGTKSLADYAKEFSNVVGEDPFQAKLMDRMDKMDTAAAEQAKQAPWMALATAGLGMAAGTSPYALKNISEGALAGVKSYGDAKEKMAALEEKRFGLMADIAKAKRAEQLAIASKGADSRDAQLARDQAERLTDKKIASDLQIHILDNTYDIKKSQIAAAAKTLPTQTDIATKILPEVEGSKEYIEGLKALENKYGSNGIKPGAKYYNDYLKDVNDLKARIYSQKTTAPGAGTSGVSGQYVIGKGFTF